MKYEIVTPSIHIQGKTIKKYDGKKVRTLDDEKYDPALLGAAHKAGFIKPVDSKGNNPAEVIANYLKSDKAEVKAEVKAEAKAEAKAEVKPEEKAGSKK